MSPLVGMSLILLDTQSNFLCSMNEDVRPELRWNRRQALIFPMSNP